MSAKIATTRSSVNLLATPDIKADILESLGPDELIEIIEDGENLVKVRSKRWRPQIEGYLPKASLAPKEEQPVSLPTITRPGSQQKFSAILPDLKASQFEHWLHSTKAPYWLPSSSLNHIKALDHSIRDFVNDHRIEWTSWLGELNNQNRLDTAQLQEWLTQLHGGRDMWSIRAERIFDAPSEQALPLGWISSKDILFWNGSVFLNNDEPKYKEWYQVEIVKLEKHLKGWFKAALLEEYVWTESDFSLEDAHHAETVFDLSKPALRLPDDAEIKIAIEEKRQAAQYIDIREVLGWSKIHHNLCGEFCVAALANSNIIPLLKRWKPAYRRTQEILEMDSGTGVQDLQNLLRLHDLQYELFRIEPSVAPITPGYLAKNLNLNRKAIVGVGINSDGKVDISGKIRHWVVVEDIFRVGLSGWVRIYNPFHNREEVYPFHVLFDPKVATGYGIWVESIVK